MAGVHLLAHTSPENLIMVIYLSNQKHHMQQYKVGLLNLGEQVKVLQKGKITIPSDIRQKLGIDEGDYVKLQIIDNKLVLFPPNTVPNPTELLTGLVEGVQVSEPVKEELRKAVAARVRKKTVRNNK
jgi:AbrB family looped-hinge helix DNA binding protein